MKFYSNLNLQQNQLIKAVLENVALALGTEEELQGIAGQIVYNLDDELVYIYNSEEWVTIGSAATITVTGGTDVDVTNGVFQLNQMDNQEITIDHAVISTTETTSDTSPLLGTDFTVVDSVITDGRGHITGFNVKTVTVEHPDLNTPYSTTADNSTTLSGIEFIVELSVDSAGHVSAAEFRKLVAGTDIVVSPTSNGNVTFDHADITRTDGTDSDETPNFGDDVTVVSSITTSATGHVTEVKTKKIAIPELTVLDTDSGTWITDVEIDLDEVTISRSDVTEAKITVGELHVSDEGDGTGKVLIDDTLKVIGNTELDEDLLVGGDVTITGDLTVNGNVTSINTEEVSIEDNLILINSNQTGTPSELLVSGLEVNRGDLVNYQFVFVEQTDDFRIGKVGDLQPVLTRDEVGNLTNDQILVWDNTNKRAVGKNPEEIAVARKFAFDLPTDVASNSTQTITHNFATKDVSVTLYDKSDDSIVYATVRANTTNTVQVLFGNVPATNAFRAVIIG